MEEIAWNKKTLAGYTHCRKCEHGDLYEVMTEYAAYPWIVKGGNVVFEKPKRPIKILDLRNMSEKMIGNQNARKSPPPTSLE